MSERAPWFRLYAADELDRVQGLGPAAAGVYFLALLRQWRDGSLPADPDAIAKALRLPPAQFRPAWAKVEHLFPLFSGGARGAPHVAEQREVATARTEQAKQAARARWDNYRQDNTRTDAGALPKQSTSNAYQDQDQDQDQPKTTDQQAGGWAEAVLHELGQVGSCTLRDVVKHLSAAYHAHGQGVVSAAACYRRARLREGPDRSARRGPPATDFAKQFGVYVQQATEEAQDSSSLPAFAAFVPGSENGSGGKPGGSRGSDPWPIRRAE